MAVRVKCTNPSCGTSMSVAEQNLGQMFRCSACGTTFVASAQVAAAKPWYLQWYAFAGAGGAVLLLIVIGTVLAFVFSGSGSAPVATNDQPAPAPMTSTPSPTPDPAPAASAPALRINAATAANVEPGATVLIDVAIDRAGVQGPIKISAEGLPEKVTAVPVEIAPNQNSVKLTVAAAADAADGELPIRILAQAGESQGEHSLTVSVKKVLPPKFLPLNAVSLQLGQTATVDVQLERNGHEGPIQIKLDGLPAQVTAKPLVIAAGEATGKLELSAGANAPEAAKDVRVLATVAGRSAEAPLQIRVQKFPYRLLPVEVVWLKPGESIDVDVKIERRSFTGPLELKIEGLPDQVTAAPITIAANQLTAKLKLSAAEAAKDRVRSAKLSTSAAGHDDRQPLIVRVKKGEGMLLPEVGLAPELANLLKRGSFGGRLTAENKAALMDIFGGTPESEAAVLEGLIWLARHQAPDGHWSLEGYDKFYTGCDCKILFEADVDKNDTAGTAFGLLPFLGAGITHDRAPDSPAELARFKDAVRLGLAFLIQHQTTSTKDDNGNLGGGMYSHALGTIALCEAYALSNDQKLQVPAQKAVTYLLKAQHGGTGGWGYGPQQEGDTSILAWVCLAIRSGQMSRIPINPKVLDLAGRFLNSTAAGPEPFKKSQYAYKPGMPAKQSLTAAGLLSRQYLGWLQDQPELPEGVKYLVQHLPPEDGKQVGPNYYYYYATQVLHHMEGKEWDLWNHRMREHLIATQIKEGHAKGSWSPEGSDYGDRGGRMYSTAMSTLTLEVYYRHLPLYRKVPKLVEQ